ncbi:MAG: hypothetical protein HKP52_04735 [Desulfofustis sp.]|nr:hypothetical protein [Desulfofustis sp.]NNK13526.1 hypothetical protein [Desulfofustis sp.]RZW25377.1 MAG: hypothetical protein EX260_03375 [Desulfobulbaceae bacterium]
MDKKRRWLRISYWLAAIADFAIAILCLIPSRMGMAHYVYPMGLMSATAFSWGVLLVIADREPIDRRWILPPTMLVVALLGMVGAHAGITGVLPVSRAITSATASLIVLSVLIYSYWNTRALDRS